MLQLEDKDRQRYGSRWKEHPYLVFQDPPIGQPIDFWIVLDICNIAVFFGIVFMCYLLARKYVLLHLNKTCPSQLQCVIPQEVRCYSVSQM